MYVSVASGRYRKGGETIEQAVEHFKNLKVPKGYQRGYMVVDRKTGKWLTFNLWDTEEEARGHETSDLHKEHLRHAEEQLGSTDHNREVYELVAERGK